MYINRIIKNSAYSIILARDLYGNQHYDHVIEKGVCWSVQIAWYNLVYWHIKMICEVNATCYTQKIWLKLKKM